MKIPSIERRNTGVSVWWRINKHIENLRDSRDNLFHFDGAASAFSVNFFAFLILLSFFSAVYNGQIDFLSITWGLFIYLSFLFSVFSSFIQAFLLK